MRISLEIAVASRGADDSSPTPGGPARIAISGSEQPYRNL